MGLPRLEPRVSLVAIFYNCAPFVEAGVASFLNQTRPFDEIILVDDGSTDDTGSLLAEFSRIDGVTVHSKENGGPASARNAGVQLATGDYIIFSDGDDILAPHLAHTLISTLVRTGAEAAFGGQKILTEAASTQPIVWEGNGAITMLTTEEATTRLMYDEISEGPFAKLLRRSFLLEHPCPEGRYYEDVAIAGEWLTNLKSVAAVDREVYGYILHSGSISHRKQSSIAQARDFQWAIRQMLQPVKDTFGSINGTAYRLLLENARLIQLLEKVSGDDQEVKDIRKAILLESRRVLNTVLADRRVSAIQKIRFAIMCRSPKLYIRLMRAYEKNKKGLA